MLSSMMRPTGCDAGNAAFSKISDWTVFPRGVGGAVKNALSGRTIAWEHLVEAVLKKGILSAL